MTISINLPDELAVKLQSKAETQNVSPESLAIDILTNALETGVNWEIIPPRKKW
jgi:hypothetical protein